MGLNRRDFLATAALGTLASRLQGQPAAPWFDKPMRWAQLTLAENDPGRYDLGFWLDYFRRIHADAVCLSAGGVVAYYPTKIPLHHRSAWMADADPFGDLLAGCRKLGLIAVARVDPHAVHQDVYDAHPDWIAVDATGKKRRHWGSPEMWVTCALGPYNPVFLTAVMKEIVSSYKVDAVFANRWDGSGMCYCEHCQTDFRAASGHDLPRTANPRDAALRDYTGWREKRLFDHWRLWDTEIRKIDPNTTMIPNTGGGALSTPDMKLTGELAKTLFADHQARHGVMAPWANGKNVKEYRAVMGSKPVAAIFSVGLEEPYRWKDSVQGADELRLWVADATANGARPWFTKFSGIVYDHRWLKTIEDIYGWHYRNERYLRNEQSLARVGLVYSQQTAQFYGGEQAQAKVEDHILGFYQALIEARVPFEMVHDGLLDAVHLDRLRTLILPNVAALSDRQCAQVRAFVDRGGSLIATHETSLYDEWGVRRKDFGLAGMFGCSFAGRVEGPTRNSYLAIEKDPQSGRYHPLVAGLEDATRIINGVHRVVVRPAGRPGYAPLTLIPSYPDLPMEKQYPRVANSGEPEVYLRQYGQGRVLYFPWDVDRTFWEVLNTDHGRLLRNAIEWATGETPMVTVEGPGMFDVTVWRQKQSMTVHLVNLTNPMAMKGPIREVIPVSVHVSIRMPAGAKVTGVRLLVAGQTPASKNTNGTVSLDVAAIGIHEVVAVDLG